MREAKPKASEPVAAERATLFSMRNVPLLEQGTTYDALATAENLWLSIKVYAGGGENAMHAHGGEDHAFIVLQGKATFTFGDGNTAVVSTNEGIMIPRGVQYKFVADKQENLVMLRAGGGERQVRGLADVTSYGIPRDVSEQTRFADGSKKVGSDPRNGENAKPRRYMKGKYFAPG